MALEPRDMPGSLLGVLTAACLAAAPPAASYSIVSPDPSTATAWSPPAPTDAAAGSSGANDPTTTSVTSTVPPVQAASTAVAASNLATGEAFWVNWGNSTQTDQGASSTGSANGIGAPATGAATSGVAPSTPTAFPPPAPGDANAAAAYANSPPNPVIPSSANGNLLGTTSPQTNVTVVTGPGSITEQAAASATTLSAGADANGVGFATTSIETLTLTVSSTTAPDGSWTYSRNYTNAYDVLTTPATSSGATVHDADESGYVYVASGSAAQSSASFTTFQTADETGALSLKRQTSKT